MKNSRATEVKLKSPVIMPVASWEEGEGQACRGYEISHPYSYPQTPIVRTYSH